MSHSKLPDFFTNAFYESKFRDNLFVVKAGGRIIQNDEALHNLLSDVHTLAMAGIRVVIIYGFGKAMDAASEERGIPVKKLEGRRVTDIETIRLMREIVCGRMATRVGSMIAKTQLDALNLNAVPHDWLNLSLWNNKNNLDLGYVGEVDGVNTRPIQRALKQYNVICMPCVATMSDGAHCNINADRLAMHLARSLNADKLVFLSDVDGVLDKDGKTIPVITDSNMQNLIDSSTVTGGMHIKLEQCFDALKSGIKRVHLINGLRPHALNDEIYEPVGPGTMVLMESERENYMNEVEVQKAIGGK